MWISPVAATTLAALHRTAWSAKISALQRIAAGWTGQHPRPIRGETISLTRKVHCFIPMSDCLGTYCLLSKLAQTAKFLLLHRLHGINEEATSFLRSLKPRTIQVCFDRHNRQIGKSFRGPTGLLHERALNLRVIQFLFSIQCASGCRMNVQASCRRVRL